MNMTEQLELIEVIPAPVFLFSPYRLKPISGYTQVLFDRQNTPTFMVKPAALTTIPVKVRRGKFIVKVSHQPYAYSFTGTITTNDHFTYTYQTTVVLRIVDPWSVAVEYIQGRDPAKQALDFIRSMFEHHATGTSIDTVRSQEIPFAYWNDLRPAGMGVTVEQQGQVKFIKAAEYIGYDGEVLRIREQKEIQLHRLRADREVQQLKNMIQWEQERTHNEFRRQEATKDYLYELRKELTLVSKQKFEGILHQSIQEGFASNETTEEIAKGYFNLLGIFYENRYTRDRDVFLHHQALEDQVNGGTREDGLRYPNDDSEDTEDVVNSVDMNDEFKDEADDEYEEEDEDDEEDSSVGEGDF